MIFHTLCVKTRIEGPLLLKPILWKGNAPNGAPAHLVKIAHWHYSMFSNRARSLKVIYYKSTLPNAITLGTTVPQNGPRNRQQWLSAIPQRLVDLKHNQMVCVWWPLKGDKKTLNHRSWCRTKPCYYKSIHNAMDRCGAIALPVSTAFYCVLCNI